MVVVGSNLDLGLIGSQIHLKDSGPNNKIMRTYRLCTYVARLLHRRTVGLLK